MQIKEESDVSPRATRRVRFCLFLLAFLLAAQSHAANVAYTNTLGGSWETAANWSLGTTPVIADAAFVTNNGTYTVILTDTTADTDPGGASSWLRVNNLTVGNASGLATLLLNFTNTSRFLSVTNVLEIGGAGLVAGERGNVVVSNGTLVVSNNFNIGSSGAAVGNLEIHGGTVFATLNGAALRVGNGSTATGMILVTAGEFIVTNGASSAAFIGNAGRGTLIQSNGVTRFNQLRLGASSAGNGEWNLYGGTGHVLSTSASALQLGASAAGTTGKVLVAGGTLNMAGTAQVGNLGYGSITLSNGSLTAGIVTLGSGATGSGDFNMYGGTAQLVLLNVGDGGAGSRGAALITGGTLTASGNANGTINVGDSAGALASLEIRGGLVVANGGSSDLRIGNVAGATGTVLITGGELNVTNGAAATSYIGNAGRGTLTASNAVVRLMQVRLGNSGTGQGNGEWNIYGGTSEVLSTSASAIIMGVAAGTTGKVNVANSKFSAAGGMDVGGIGFGSLIVSNSAFTSGDIKVGAGTAGAGEVHLYDGPGTNTIGTVTVASGSSSRGAFTFHSGESTVFRLNAGEAGGTLGTIYLDDGTVLVTDTGAPIRLGNVSGGTGVLNVASGTLIVTNSNATSFIGNAARGTLNQSNGTVLLGAVRLGASGAGYGDLNVIGGTNQILTTLGLGQAASNTGNVLVAGGRLDVGGFTTVGVGGYGRLVVSNGTLVTRGINVGQNANAGGEVRFSGGLSTLANPVGDNLVVGTASNSVSNVLITDSAIVEFNRSLTLGGTQAGTPGIGTLTNQNGGTMRFIQSVNDPTFVIRPGSVVVVTNAIVEFRDFSGAKLNGGITNITFLGNNTVSLNNSTNAVLGSYTFQTNNAPSFANLRMINGTTRWQSTNLNIGTGGTLLASNTLGSVRGIVTNAGTITVVNSKMTWESNVVIQGRYVSDPSTNTFLADVTIAESGSLAGGTGDLFDFKKSLFINSTNDVGFNLSASGVKFSGGGMHTNAITGLDYGTNDLGFAANFAYGELHLGSVTDRVCFTCGNIPAIASNGLYIGWLDLLGSTNLVANLHAPTSINLYYDKTDTRNAYLGGLSYALTDCDLVTAGGLLMPVIPEPSACVFVAAACALWLRRVTSSRSR